MTRAAVDAIHPERLQNFTEILHEAALRLNRHEDIDHLLHDVVDLAQEAVAADSCLVYLCDERSGDLVLRASSNAHPNELGRLHIRVGEGITGWVAQQRRPVTIAHNAARDPRFKLYSSLPEDQYEAFLSVPVLNRNTVLGVINLQHRAKHEHHPLEVKTVSALGLMLGEALDREAHMSRRDESQRMLEGGAAISDLLCGELQAAVPRVVEHLRTAVGALVVAVVFAGESNANSGIPSDQATTWLTLAENAAGPIVDGGATAIVPLRRENEFAGCVVCQYALASEISEERMRMQSLVARWLTIAVQLRTVTGRCREYESALAARKVIERAKGILQREKNISEDEAYRLLQLESRRNRRPMVTVAQALLTSRALNTAARESPAGASNPI